MGQVSPTVCAGWDLSVPVFFGRFDLAKVAAHRAMLTQVVSLPRYPAVERDLALAVPEDVPARRVEEIVRDAGAPLLQRVVLFDVYRGKGLAEGEKSLGFSLEFRASERTLTDQDVDEVLRRLVARAADEVGARIRT